MVAAPSVCRRRHRTAPRRSERPRRGRSLTLRAAGDKVLPRRPRGRAAREGCGAGRLRRPPPDARRRSRIVRQRTVPGL